MTDFLLILTKKADIQHQNLGLAFILPWAATDTCKFGATASAKSPREHCGWQDPETKAGIIEAWKTQQKVRLGRKQISSLKSWVLPPNIAAWSARPKTISSKGCSIVAEVSRVSKGSCGGRTSSNPHLSSGISNSSKSVILLWSHTIMQLWTKLDIFSITGRLYQLSFVHEGYGVNLQHVNSDSLQPTFRPNLLRVYVIHIQRCWQLANTWALFHLANIYLFWEYLNLKIN